MNEVMATPKYTILDADLAHVMAAAQNVTRQTIEFVSELPRDLQNNASIDTMLGSLRTMSDTAGYKAGVEYVVGLSTELDRQAHEDKYAPEQLAQERRELALYQHGLLAMLGIKSDEVTGVLPLVETLSIEQLVSAEIPNATDPNLERDYNTAPYNVRDIEVLMLSLGLPKGRAGYTWAKLLGLKAPYDHHKRDFAKHTVVVCDDNRFEIPYIKFDRLRAAANRNREHAPIDLNFKSLVAFMNSMMQIDQTVGIQRAQRERSFPMTYGMNQKFFDTLRCMIASRARGSVLEQS